MSTLANNVFQMTNAELIGLAKNRFLDAQTQEKIALNRYTRAHMYLVQNEGLSVTARDILWNKKGYVNKFDLVSQGHYRDQPEKYIELYDGYAKQATNRGSFWRVSRAFLGGIGQGMFYGELIGPKYTPGPILEDIYNNIVADKSTPEFGAGYYKYSVSRMIAENSNTPTSVIVRLSCSAEHEGTRKIALKELGRRG
tara:strand:- start:8 stop:598 length:591 start_codon:yes stop_codon:yes gene_type:complete